MNFIDILLILIFIAMLATGFFQGMIRLMVMLLAFYLSLVLASLYYGMLGNWLMRNFDTERFVGQYVGFALVLFVSLLLLVAAGLYTFRYAKMPGQLEYVDRIIGTVLGLVMGLLLVGLIALLLWNMMIVRGGRNIDFPIMAALGRSVSNSFVLGLFANTVLPEVYTIIDPLLPAGAELIFSVR